MSDCPACLEGRCVLHAHGTDPNTVDLSAMFGGNVPRDYRASVDAWRQQAQDEQEARQRAAREHEEAEAEFHRSRADFLSRGGKL